MLHLATWHCHHSFFLTQGSEYYLPHKVAAGIKGAVHTRCWNGNCTQDVRAVTKVFAMVAFCQPTITFHTKDLTALKLTFPTRASCYSSALNTPLFFFFAYLFFKMELESLSQSQPCPLLTQAELTPFLFVSHRSLCLRWCQSFLVLIYCPFPPI